MALNNMTNTPEAVEEHIRKQIEGSGIGQVMAQAILAAQKPMTLAQVAQKHNLEPESAKAITPCGGLPPEITKAPSCSEFGAAGAGRRR